MILHKYLKAEHGIQAIIQSQLKVSVPSELNDPFEFLPKDSAVWTKAKVKKFLKDKARQNRIYKMQKDGGHVKNKKEFKERIKDIDSWASDLLDRFQSKEYWEVIQESKKDNDEYMRLISFSSEYAISTDEILMWSHYCANHTGIRLHYDSKALLIPPFELRKIKYSNERPPVDHTLDNRSNKLMGQLIVAMITKSECWNYEKEYRLFVDPDYCTNTKIEEKKIYFTKLQESSLIRVDVGLNFDEMSLGLIQEAKKRDRFKHVNFFKAELNKDKYKLDYIRI